MKKPIDHFKPILFVLVVLEVLSMACGLMALTAKQPTPTVDIIPSDVPTLEPVDTATPEAAPPGDTATPDPRVTNSDTADAMVNNMAQDPVLSSSIADDVLKKSVLKTLVDNTYQTGCTYGFSKVTVTKAPTDTQSEWDEEWVMAVCNKITTLQIVFTPDPEGGTNYKIDIK